MTCIAGRADSKVFRNGPFIMGFTASFRMGQLLRYSLVVPDHDPRVEVEKYMATSFINAVRQCLKDGGYAEKNNEVESGGTFLVGYKGRLFEIEDDYQVGESLNGFAAVGCGFAYALGSLHSTDGMKPEDRIRKALVTAEHFNAGVRGPFVILNSENT